jgi:ubiquinone/menaquinone biosynthesis C-methylase UbiE
MSTFNTDEFKTQQTQSWDAAAEAWERWDAVIVAGGAAICERIAELAQLEPGHRVLDIASGTGEPALTLAKALNGTGAVLLTDQSEMMLGVAERRAKAKGINNAKFINTEGSELDIGEEKVNVVTSRWGLSFVPDWRSSVANFTSHMVPGARVVICVWAAPNKVAMIWTAMSVVGERYNPPKPPPGMPGPFTMADPSALVACLEENGFTGVEVERFNVAFSFDSAEEYTRLIGDTAAPVLKLLSTKSKEEQEATWAAIAERAMTLHANDDGGVSMDNEAILVSATLG